MNYDKDYTQSRAHFKQGKRNPVQNRPKKKKETQTKSQQTKVETVFDQKSHSQLMRGNPSH